MNEFIRPVLDNNKIYHYCKLSTTIEHILLNKKLLLNSIVNTNDPRENKNLLFAYGYDHTINRPENLLELNEKYSNMIRNDCKVLCFSQDYKNYQGCHLSKMWAQYGDNHKGVCLEINLEKFILENSFIEKELFQKVKYLKYDYLRHPNSKQIVLTRLNSDGEENYIKNIFRKDNLEYLFFSKNDEWEAESEIRLISFGNHIHKLKYCSIANSLESVHLGIDFHNSYLPSIKELALGKSIYKMKFLHNGLVSSIEI